MEIIEEVDMWGKRAEDFVKLYYLKRNYKLIKLPSKNIKDFTSIHKNIDIKMEAGIPDYLVFDDNEFFFVEVKSQNDSLRVEQMRWYSKNNKNFRIVYFIVTLPNSNLPQYTDMMGIENGIPIVRCFYRKDFFGGLRFYCGYCRKEHLHGRGEGHRSAHCINPGSPFNETGYILKLDEFEIMSLEDQERLKKLINNPTQLF